MKLEWQPYTIAVNYRGFWLVADKRGDKRWHVRLFEGGDLQTEFPPFTCIDRGESGFKSLLKAKKVLRRMARKHWLLRRIAKRRLANKRKKT